MNILVDSVQGLLRGFLFIDAIRQDRKIRELERKLNERR